MFAQYDVNRKDVYIALKVLCKKLLFRWQARLNISFSTLKVRRHRALFYEPACIAISSFSNINFTNTLNSGIQYCGKLCRNYWPCIYLPKTRTSTERCAVKLCLFLAVHVYVPSSALRCTVSINSVPLATLCLILVGSFTSPDNSVQRRYI